MRLFPTLRALGLAVAVTACGVPDDLDVTDNSGQLTWQQSEDSDDF